MSKRATAAQAVQDIPTQEERVQQELRALFERRRQLVPEDLVEWARSHPNSALYRRFTWDDTEAAYKWRLQEARQLIGTFKVPITPNSPVLVRGAVSTITPEKKRIYGLRQEALSKKQVQQQQYEQAVSELQQWCRRYTDVPGVDKFVPEIQKTIRKMEGS